MKTVHWLANGITLALLICTMSPSRGLAAPSVLDIQAITQKIEKKFAVKFTATSPQEAIDESYALLMRIKTKSFFLSFCAGHLPR
jgi:hypothetical protein